MQLFGAIPLVFSITILAAVGECRRRLKVLVYSPSLGYSHVAFQGKLADLLVDGGHEVHFFIPEIDPKLNAVNGSAKAHRIIRLERPHARHGLAGMGIMMDPYAGFNNMLIDGTTKAFIEIYIDLCRDLLREDDLLEHLASEKYDVAITESLDVCAFGLFHLTGARTNIGSLAIPMGELARSLGIPSPSSFVPITGAPSISADRMSYFERVLNFFVQSYFNLVLAPQAESEIQALFTAKYGAGFPDLLQLQRDMSYAFVNSNQFFAVPRPVSHKVVYVGGIVEKKPKPLSQEIQDIFDNTRDGVVLFSFGSMASTDRMSVDLKRAFLDAFARFPTYDFVWKYSHSYNDSDLFARYPNVHTFDWVDQVSILANPKTRAFITHCGLNSLNEVAYAGMPVVAVPLFGDQLSNAAIIARYEIGIFVEIGRMTEDVLVDALTRVIKENKYRDNAMRIKQKLELYPFKPAEKFVKLVEFAAEFDSLNEMNLVGAEFSFFKFYCLDIILPTMLVIAAIVLSLSYATVQVLSRVTVVKKKVE